jgi:hypothetical protein
VVVTKKEEEEEEEGGRRTPQLEIPETVSDQIK